MNKIGNYLCGIIFVVLGVIFGLNALEITNIDIFFNGWWTLLIIVPAFINLFKKDSKMGSLIWLLIGISLLLICQDIISFSLILKLLFPFILILVGLSIIFRNYINQKFLSNVKEIKNVTDKDYYATFGQTICDLDDGVFEGCNLNGVFGSCKCDLTKVKINEDVLINASAIFGEVVIIVPKGVNVKIISTNIFGGCDNKVKNPDKKYDNTLIIKSLSLFGGVTVR